MCWCYFYTTLQLWVELIIIFLSWMKVVDESVWSFHPPQPDLNVDFVVMHFFHYKMSCTLVLSKRVSYDIPIDLSVAIKLEEQHQHSNLVSANMLSI